jgi:hypothetical protein
VSAAGSGEVVAGRPEGATSAVRPFNAVPFGSSAVICRAYMTGSRAGVVVVDEDVVEVVVAVLVIAVVELVEEVVVAVLVAVVELIAAVTLALVVFVVALLVEVVEGRVIVNCDVLVDVACVTTVDDSLWVELFGCALKDMAEKVPTTRIIKTAEATAAEVLPFNSNTRELAGVPIPLPKHPLTRCYGREYALVLPFPDEVVPTCQIVVLVYP